MLVIDLVPLLTRLTYLLIAGLTLADFLRHRDRTRFDIALVFVVLAVNVLIQEYGLLTNQPPPPALAYLSSVTLLAQPHLLLRTVTHFRPVPRQVLLASTIALGLSLVALALPLMRPNLTLPLPAILLIVAYFAWAEGYASVAFVRGALTTGGVTRWRYRLAALGALLVAAVIVGGFGLGFFPTLAPYSRALTESMGLVSGLAFYLAFAPPRWVRRFWQFSELHRFLHAWSGQPVRERASHILPFLCEAGQRALGGSAALAALDAGVAQQLVVRATTWASFAGHVIDLSASGPLPSAWRERRAVVANQRQDLAPVGIHLVAAVGGEALCVVPIATPERAWGLLIVLLQRRPLFPDDDMELLGLFAEQAALTLDQDALLNEQADLIASLRDRTAQLESANHELEAFSYSVSHDLRAPLRHIEGFTELLTRADVPEPLRSQHLTRIADAAMRMGQLIDSLLTFSRMGRADLQRLPVPLDRVVADARLELAGEAHDRAVEWVVSPLPVVQGDPDLLRLVFVNLLSNALKYSRDQQPARLEVGALPATDGEAVVYVRDNGVGFDMQYSDKLFGVFQRLHHANEFEGVGIGLANVRRIIHRHGGRTWAEGQVNGGATFYVSFPSLAPTAARPLPVAPALTAAATPGGPTPYA